MSQLTPQFLAQKAWDLYQTHGVPFEVSEDILEQNELKLDQDFLNKLIEEHQSLSRTTSAGQFKSGLGEQTDKTKKLHTATHILHVVLRHFFGDETKQMGSAITNEKARFDFSLERSFTPQELDQIESEVQKLVDLKLQMNKIETTEKEAREMGAIGLFGEKYGDKVSVYSLQDETGKVYSREFCGGPHVANSSEIGKFKVLKQKSVGQGIRRLEFDVE